MNWTESTENQSSFEWNIFPGHTILGLFREIRMKIGENRIRPEEFRDRIIFMSMYTDVDWTKDGNLNMCISNSIEVKAYAKRFPKGHWSFPGPGTEKMVAREMGSSRLAISRRRRTRENPEPACVQTPFLLDWHTQGGEGESIRSSVVPFSRRGKVPPVRHTKTRAEERRRRKPGCLQGEVVATW